MKKAPTWTEESSKKRAAGKVAHVIALWKLRDQIDLSNKSEVARRLGISRWTLDRYLATIQEADALAEKIIETYGKRINSV